MNMLRVKKYELEKYTNEKLMVSERHIDGVVVSIYQYENGEGGVTVIDGNGDFLIIII